MHWANFLHIYQPPTQKEIWVRRISDECYRKLFKGLLKIPHARLTLNINGILCELLEKYDGKDILEDIRELLRRGNLELTGSAKYHAFLPLLPESEIERQILLNEATLRKYFGDDWKKRGFFSPEMAYSKKVAAVAKRLGYEWIIIDELAASKGERSHHDTVHTIEGLENFGVFFRERNLSFIILSSQGAGTVPTVLRYLGERLTKEEYVVTAMDGETFGHHRPGLEIFFFELLESKEVESVQISDLFTLYPKRKSIEPFDSTWAVTKNDLKTNQPFARWNAQENTIQQAQWELTRLALDAANREPIDPHVRDLLDKALHSDQYWWASARPWWSLEMIERGGHELVGVIKQSPHSTEAEKKKADDLYQHIIYTGFEWQRTGLVDEISRKEDEEIRERLEEKEKLFITKKEYAQMIDTLKNQVKIAVNNEEYHRAAMIKDRIIELNEELKKAKE